jgi:hypothetical protein
MVLCQIFGSRVRVDSTAKVAEIEMAEKEKMKEKVERILKHGINCFINRYTHTTRTMYIHTHTPHTRTKYIHTHHTHTY